MCASTYKPQLSLCGGTPNIMQLGFLPVCKTVSMREVLATTIASPVDGLWRLFWVCSRDHQLGYHDSLTRTLLHTVIRNVRT